MKKIAESIKHNIIEIISSPSMILFILIFLGLIYFLSLKDVEEKQKKELNAWQPSTQVIFNK